jgi:hypothetical protein
MRYNILPFIPLTHPLHKPSSQCLTWLSCSPAPVPAGPLTTYEGSGGCGTADQQNSRRHWLGAGQKVVSSGISHTCTQAASTYVCTTQSAVSKHMPQKLCVVDLHAPFSSPALSFLMIHK